MMGGEEGPKTDAEGSKRVYTKVLKIVQHFLVVQSLNTSKQYYYQSTSMVLERHILIRHFAHRIRSRDGELIYNQHRKRRNGPRFLLLQVQQDFSIDSWPLSRPADRLVSSLLTLSWTINWVVERIRVSVLIRVLLW